MRRWLIKGIFFLHSPSSLLLRADGQYLNLSWTDDWSLLQCWDWNKGGHGRGGGVTHLQHSQSPPKEKGGKKVGGRNCGGKKRRRENPLGNHHCAPAHVNKWWCEAAEYVQKNPTCVPETSGSFSLVLTDSLAVASSISALKLLSVAALSLRSPVGCAERKQGGRTDEKRACK